MKRRPLAALVVLAACSGSGTDVATDAITESEETALPVEVAPTGVPGLDSDDAFCAAWSRWAGSLQIVAVTAAFGEGPPESVATLEVLASPVVVDAYADMFEHWPVELDAERDAAAAELFGPFTRRLEVAHHALVAAGADDANLDAVTESWLATLAARDPSVPDVVVDLAPELWPLVDATAAEFAAQRVPFGDDPSLQTDPATPATLAYVDSACPDAGALAGLEVE